MQELVDQVTELYHSSAWGSSIKTASGDHAFYNDDPEGTPVLPGDVVKYTDEQDGCVKLGVVIQVCRDKRAGRVEQTLARIYELRSMAELLHGSIGDNTRRRPAFEKFPGFEGLLDELFEGGVRVDLFDDDTLVLLEDCSKRIFIPTSRLQGPFTPIYTDGCMVAYDDIKDLEDPFGRPETRQKAPIPLILNTFR